MEGWSSPHCKQYVVANNGRQAPDASASFCRVLRPDCPTEAYRRRRGEAKTVLHWGQRKLLLSEVEFITLALRELEMCGSSCARSASGKLFQWVVVYAGAAPGKHLNFLADLFHNVEFHAYDPNPFSCRGTDQLHVHQQYFVDNTAREWSRRSDVLFISDVRTADPAELEREDVEEYVRADMDAQMHWHELMRPRLSMLKFRLPYGRGCTRYLEGRIFLPVWGAQTTTESRLVVKQDASVVEWDNLKYQDQMFFFNTKTRVFQYRHDVVAEGLDFCFDCRSEIEILKNYISGFCVLEDGVEWQEVVGRMSERISLMLSRNRTLSLPQPPPGHRGKMGIVAHYEVARALGSVDAVHALGVDGALASVLPIDSAQKSDDSSAEEVLRANVEHLASMDGLNSRAVDFVTSEYMRDTGAWLAVVERSFSNLAWLVSHARGLIGIRELGAPECTFRGFSPIMPMASRGLPTPTVLLGEWDDDRKLFMVLDVAVAGKYNVRSTCYVQRLAMLEEIVLQCDFEGLSVVVKRPASPADVSRLRSVAEKNIVPCPASWMQSGGARKSSWSWVSAGLWVVRKELGFSEMWKLDSLRRWESKCDVALADVIAVCVK